MVVPSFRCRRCCGDAFLGASKATDAAVAATAGHGTAKVDIDNQHDKKENAKSQAKVIDQTIHCPAIRAERSGICNETKALL